MFKFLKEKIKQAVNKITHRVEEEVLSKQESSLEQPFEKSLGEKSSQKETSFLEKLEQKETLKETLKETRKEVEKEKEEIIEKPSIEVQKDLEIVKQIDELEKFDKEIGKKEIGKEVTVEEVSKAIKEEEKEEKKGFFVKLKEKIVTKKIDEARFNELFWELELALLENNVAVEVIEKIKHDLRKNLIDKPIKRGEVDAIVEKSLKDSISSLFDVDSRNIIKEIKSKKEKPYVIVFLGLNGSGKTTSVAKLAKILQNNKLKCVLVAGDTWRQAAIEQLEEHGKKLGIKVIKHGYGADPAAVAFDGIQHAKAKELDVVLIDTAGRLHSNINLMQEIKKIVKVAKPDMKIFVGESITGNDCVEQAKKFDEAISIDGIILTKADVDEKGGAAVSISYVVKKPILYFGIGQRYEDMREFDKKDVLKTLGLDF